MKAEEIRGRSTDDIRSMISDMQRRLFELRMFGHTEESSDVHEANKIRRDIARCKSILSEMAHQGAAESGAQ